MAYKCKQLSQEMLSDVMNDADESLISDFSERHNVAADVAVDKAKCAETLLQKAINFKDFFKVSAWCSLVEVY
jgi:hypothetical protein